MPSLVGSEMCIRDRSREDELVGVVRGGSVCVRARVPAPAGGVVQSGDGGAEKGLVPLGERLQGAAPPASLIRGRLAVGRGYCSGFACA